MDNPTTLFRVGLLGYGFASKTFHAPLLTHVDGLELRAIASRDPSKVAADLPDISVETDLARLIASPDLDVIVIATPNDTHAPLAAAALHAGKHVVVDKPLTLDLAEARGLFQLAKEVGRHLMVFHNRRWDSDYLSVRQAIQQATIGEVNHFESHFDRFRPEVRDRWRERAGPGSGAWWDLGPHLIDQALQLFGLPDYVQGNLTHHRFGSQTTDWAHVVLEYGERRRVLLHVGMLVAGGTNRFTVHGSKGSLVKRQPDRQETQLIDGMKPGAPGWGADPDPIEVHNGSSTEKIPATPGDQRRIYAGLVDALRGVSPIPVRPIDALAVMAVLEAAIQSSQNRCSLSLSLTSEERAAWQ